MGEVFEKNSFEQMCINYSNEKLQLHFNEVIFQAEMDLYMSEGVPTDNVSYVDNTGCVMLVEGKPIDIVSLLEEECSLGSGTDTSFMSKIKKQFLNNKNSVASPYFGSDMQDDNVFVIKHFAGPVSYTVTDFLDKNRDLMSDTMKGALANSKSNVIGKI